MENKISKEKARELLQKYISNQRGLFPIYDANIMIANDSNGNYVLTEYTFKYLLQIAYDLKTEWKYFSP